MRKIIIFTILFFVLVQNIFAFEIELKSNKTEINANENLQVQIIVSDAEENIEIGKIPGMENFDIISTSSFNKSFVNIVAVNGKQEQKKVSKSGINLTLSPKNKGNFELGPVEARNSKETKKSNSILVNVNMRSEEDSEEVKKDNVRAEENSENNVSSKKGLEIGNISIKIIFVLIIISLIIIILFYSRKKEKVEDIDNDYNLEENKLEKEENITFDSLLKGDEDLLDRLEKYLKQVFKNKYNFDKRKNLRSILQSEMLSDTNEKQKIKKLIDTFEQIKYGNYDNLIKEFLEMLEDISREKENLITK